MKRFTAEQIVSKLRQADVELGKGVVHSVDPVEFCVKVDHRSVIVAK